MNFDENFFNLIATQIPREYAKQALEGATQQRNKVASIFSQRRLPEEGLSVSAISALLNSISLLDSNNHPKNIGVGEREGRVFSSLVATRNYGLAHGVGRSGDLTENQPKAVGSSLLHYFTNKLALDVVKLVGIKSVQDCLVTPIATGMSLSLCLRSLASQRSGAKYVIWSRIDQKSCFKAITSLGLIPVVVQCVLRGDELVTNLGEIEAKIGALKAEEVVCVYSTTSCFSPRAPDDVVSIARLCKKYSLPHLINNAYGLQEHSTCHAINKAINCGRVDLIVQSTDKNFMVPVGGAIIASPSAATLMNVAKCYPGRASVAPILDLFITLLEMGRKTYTELLETRKLVRQAIVGVMEKYCRLFKVSMLDTKSNPISMALCLDSVRGDKSDIGRKLYFRSVSGCRVFSSTKTKTIDGYDFEGWGSHCNNYPHSYITFAASVGMKLEEVEKFSQRLGEVLKGSVPSHELVSD